LIALTKDAIQRPLGGLFLMIIFTAFWTILSEYSFDNSDHRIVGILFGIIILVFIFFYLKFTFIKKKLPESHIENKSEDDRKKAKRFYVIMGLEGLSIFVAKNILVNINLNELFIPCMALIVGLHFFALAKVFERKFDNYVGLWTCTIAIIGMVLISQKITAEHFAVAIVGMGCAISTIAYGTKIIIALKRIE